MKKALIVALVVGLMASLAVTAEAAKRKKVTREVTFEYVCPCPGILQLGSLTGGDPNFGGGPVPVGADDKYLTIVAEDMSGQAVLVNVNQDTDGDGFNNGVGSICATDKPHKPLKVNPGLEIRLFIETGPCEDGTPSLPAGGTLTLTFSNMK